MNTVEVIGWIGATISSVMIAPQALRIVQLTRKGIAPEGVSRATLILIMTNASVWFIWAAGTGAWPAAAPGLINFPLSAVALWYIRKGPTRTETDQEPCKCGWPTYPHDLFVTNPAGYGSIVHCDGTRRINVIPVQAEASE